MDFFDYRIPNRKKWLLTNEFLTTFKNELDIIFKTNEKEDNPTYWNTYTHLESTGGFYDALKVASKKHNVIKAIYEYAARMPWYNSDIFDGELVEIMCERGIIERGDIDDAYYTVSDDELNQMEANGEIKWTEEIVKHKDYSVIKRDWEFIEK